MILINIVGKFYDIKGVMRSRKSKKEKQYNGVSKDKMTNNDLQNSTQKTKNLSKNRSEIICTRRVSSSCSTIGTYHVTLAKYQVISHERGKEDHIGLMIDYIPKLIHIGLEILVFVG